MRSLKPVVCSIVLAGLSPLTLQAIELFSNEKTDLQFNGNVSVYILANDHESEISDGFSRYFFKTTHKINHGWQAQAHLEWGMQVSNTDANIVVNHNGLTSTGPADDPLWLRLGYVGASHEKYGSFSMGKQWGVTYDKVTGVTDVFEIFGGTASGVYNFGTDGGFSGTGRAEQVLKYGNDIGNFSFGVQYQATSSTIKEFDPGEEEPSALVNFDKGYSLAVSYDGPYDLGFALGYTNTNFRLTDNPQNTDWHDDTVISANVTYRDMGAEGLYVALVVVDMENHEEDNEGNIMSDATGIELYSAYRFGNDISAVLGYNSLKDNSTGAVFHSEFFVLGANYHWDDQFYLYLEGKIDSSTEADGSVPAAEDAIGLGMMFTF